MIDVLKADTMVDAAALTNAGWYRDMCTACGMRPVIGDVQEVASVASPF